MSASILISAPGMLTGQTWKDLRKYLWCLLHLPYWTPVARNSGNSETEFLQRADKYNFYVLSTKPTSPDLSGSSAVLHSSSFNLTSQGVNPTLQGCWGLDSQPSYSHSEPCESLAKRQMKDRHDKCRNTTPT